MRELVTITGERIPMPEVKSGGFKMACELAFCNKDDQRFEVRYTDGSSKLVEDTESNRRFYAMEIDLYREKMENLFK